MGANKTMSNTVYMIGESLSINVHRVRSKELKAVIKELNKIAKHKAKIEKAEYYRNTAILNIEYKAEKREHSYKLFATSFDDLPLVEDYKEERSNII